MSEQPTRPEVLAMFTREQLLGRLTTHQMYRHDLGAAVEVIEGWFRDVSRRYLATGERANSRQYAAQRSAKAEYERKLKAVNIEINSIESELGRRKRESHENKTGRFAQEFISAARRRLPAEQFDVIFEDARLLSDAAGQSV
jgi:hypothetical protein